MKKTRKFHRERNQRKAFLKSLAVNLIMRGKIATTLARAKESRIFVERMITYGKKHPSQVRKFLPQIAAIKLIKEVAPKYKERSGGYTRIIKLLPRSGDAAKMAFVEFV